MEDVHLPGGGIDAEVDCLDVDCKGGEEREGVEVHARWIILFHLPQNLEKSAPKVFVIVSLLISYSLTPCWLYIR